MALDPRPMMAAACKHSDFLAVVQYLEWKEQEDLQWQQLALPFASNTFVKFAVAPKGFEVPMRTFISSEKMDQVFAEVWVEHPVVGRKSEATKAPFGDYVELGDLERGDCVFWRVWTDECPFCEDEAKQQAAHEKELQDLRSQLKQSKDRSDEQRLQSENSQKALESRSRLLENVTVGFGRKLKTAVDENESFKQQMEKSAAEISELTDALADEFDRFSVLQQEHRAEIESERKQTAEELAALIEKLAAVEKANETLKEENECMRSQVFNFKHEDESERQNAVVDPPLFPAEFSSWREEGFVTDFCLQKRG
ncbi:hypothetical protein M3Y99_00537400 [Aphelenchoides fujianensis]|nr:hypothetical protein M3Y99_00537400 [Aphelenchoides fujianensis]